MTDPWVKHVLATSYRPRKTLLPQPGRGSPGSVVPFYPNLNNTQKKRPWLLLSGDDGGFFSVLEPIDGSSWSFKETFLCNSSNTVGSPVIEDINQDGYSDLFLPFYADGKVEVFTFKPQDTPQPRPIPTPALMA